MSRDGSGGLAVAPKRDDSEQTRSANLRAELLEAKAAYSGASQEFNELCSAVQGGLYGASVSDGNLAITQLARKQRTAFDRYQRAVYALNALVPGDEAAAERKTLAAPASSEPRITQREMQVLKALAAGKTTRGIAEELNIAFKTALTHRSHLLQKFEANNVALLIRKAILLGYIQP